MLIFSSDPKAACPFLCLFGDRSWPHPPPPLQAITSLKLPHERLDQTALSYPIEQKQSILVILQQVHGTAIHVIDDMWLKNHKGFAPPLGDALITRNSDVALGVLTADCAPILFIDQTSGVIAACHAGWRGALAGIHRLVVQKLIHMGSQKSHIQAFIGPTIAQNNYVVDDEFRAKFLDREPYASSFFQGTGSLTFDLAGFISYQLQQQGIICHKTEFDTYSGPYFSHRRSLHAKEKNLRRNVSFALKIASHESNVDFSKKNHMIS
jgi:YfiH family protein